MTVAIKQNAAIRQLGFSRYQEYPWNVVKSLYGRKWKDADYEIKPEPEDEQNDSDTANPV